MKRIPMTNNERAYARVRDKDVALVSQFQWHYQDGMAFAELHDVHELIVSIDYLISHPAIAYGSHSAN